MKRESVYVGSEKRRWPRFDLKFAKEKVTVRIEREGKVAINVRVKNISYGGLCFESYRRENFNYPMKIEPQKYVKRTIFDPVIVGDIF